jgi:hypothetical protein
MKFKRERTPSPWLVQDIYLRDTWGSPFNVSRSRRWSLRRVFFTAMLLFGIVDACLAAFFAIAYFFPPRPVNTAQRNLTPRATVVARQATTAPRPTRTRVPTNPPPAATRAVQPTAAPIQPPPTTAAIQPPPPPTEVPLRTSSIALPASLSLGALSYEIPNEPTECTPAEAMPDVVDRSVKLCPGQNYRPFHLRGDRIGVFGDKSSVIRSQGRGYGIIAEGSRLFIQNVMIRGSTESGDLNTFLCLYPDCAFRNGDAPYPGGVSYGGGILVRASETTILDSDIAGGVAGIAAERVRGLKLLNNRLDDSTGWGSYNFAVEASYFVGNTFSRDNRSCTTDAGYLPTGCESSGWVCIACVQNVIANNYCTSSGNCYYMNGEGNLNSNNNRFHQNECRAAPHNCFEVTFALGNEFVENIARDDPDTGAACKYPFWVGGSTVIFARNSWNCEFSPETSIAHATASTHIPTKIENR